MATEQSKSSNKGSIMRRVGKVGVRLPLTPEWSERFLKNSRKGELEGTAGSVEKPSGTNDVKTKLPSEINILLLGETGVGKSTWINGLVNYLTYATIAEAETSPPVSMIPTVFQMFDENYQEQTVHYGKDDRNELFEIPGQSVTQMPRTYTFSDGNSTIRIIDTPGLGDTRGIDQDRINMSNTMKHLANYEELHGICILMKPNEARLGIMFRFCIHELLRNLHRDAARNIVIGFTNARSTFYNAGESLASLRQLLSEDSYKDVHIELSRDTLYYMDNEAIKFLAAAKAGIKFDQMERKNYEISWEKSVAESVRLISYVAKLKPHQVKYTTSLNEIRSSILSLCRPIAELCRALQISIEHAQEKLLEQYSETSKRKELRKELYFPIYELTATCTDTPKVVCTAPQFVNVAEDESRTIIYNTICCNDCDVQVDRNQLGCSALRSCKAMQPSKLTCNKCNCLWQVHMQITFTTRLILRKVDIPDVQQLLAGPNEASTTKKAISVYQNAVRERIRILQIELMQLIRTSAKLSGFVKQNAITTQGDGFAEYFNHAVEVELKAAKDSNEKVSRRVRTLVQLRDSYAAETKKVDEEMSTGSSQTAFEMLQKEKLMELIMSLSSQSTAGPMLVNVMKVAQEGVCRPEPYPVHIVETNIIKRVFQKIFGRQ